MGKKYARLLNWTISVAVVVFIVLLIASGTDNNRQANAVVPSVECVGGTVRGGGSTFVQNIAQQWVKQYLTACSSASLDYKGIGSSAGIQQLTAKTVDFAGSDVRLKSEELAKLGDVTQLPWAAGAIAVMYKLDGVDPLQLSGKTLAGIFAGKVTRWDAAEIAADNPNVELPSMAIEVVHRSDGSGTTAAFTAYLHAVASDVWTLGSGKDVDWPTGQGAKGSDGVTALVESAEGTISYAEVSYAHVNGIAVMKIGNAAGKYVAPNAAAVTAALNAATIDDQLKVTMDYLSPNAQAYPISTVSYAIVPKSASPLLKAFLKYALSDGQLESESLMYAPLPSSITAPALEAIAR